MKRVMWPMSAAIAFAALILSFAQLAPSHRELSSLFPDNALLYLEAKDFRALLKDWNVSEEKRIWLKGDNYEAFSRSRLFGRLGQARDEFSTAASIPVGENLLSSIAGTQSALALYDIGNLEFVYLTRMSQAQAERTALWQVRDKFEPRTEGTAQFYVRQDQQSNRTAAFAARDGWLILGTRVDLVAGVLDRLQGAKAHSLSDETWYTDTLQQAAGSDQDLRMILNLEKIVPSPYFRSYWVQRNITEMKQYRAALCDLHRGAQSYQEDRVLLRKPGVTGNASGDVQSLLALAPTDAVFASAQASPDADRVVAEMRENVLDFKTMQMRATGFAPSNVAAENAGSTAMLEERIDVAPVIVKESDPYQPLRLLIAAAQPAAVLEAYETRSKTDDMFVGINRAIVVQSASPWNEEAMESSLAIALRPGLTTSQLGIEWKSHTGEHGKYTSLDGEIPISLAVRGNQLFLATSESLLQILLAPRTPSAPSQLGGVTYAAVFNHSPHEQQAFRKIVNRLDAAGHGGNAQKTSPEEDAAESDGQSPFFSRNIASMGRMLAHVVRESIEERDQGTQVTQKLIYEWQRP